jgi:hypothetical protein
METLRSWRRKTGKSPKTWMLNRVRLNTELVEGSREASTVEAMRAALVDSEEGNGGARGEAAAGVEADFDVGVVRLNAKLRGGVDFDGARLR